MFLQAIRQSSVLSRPLMGALQTASFHSSITNGLEMKKSTKLWGGRFARDTDDSVKKWTESVTVDSNLVDVDIWGSMAHVTMLGRQGIVPIEKSTAIADALVRLQDKFYKGEWKLGYEQEDVHMNVEAEMIRQTGMDVGGRMHTCRSRNDQVILDAKLYARKRLLELRQRVIDATNAFLDRADGLEEKEMPSYTHFQHAQPVSVAFWLSHYAAVLLRDLSRLKHAYDITDTNPLGSGAISGTSFPIDRRLTTKLLGFQDVQPHAMDATSARDYMWESLNACATVSNTLSRLAEEFILFSSYEFRTITLDDGFAMGSSMMPQKKNPGTLELIRGRCGRITGYAVAGLMMTKGLPAAYNRDFHEEKELLVSSMNVTNDMVEVIPPLIKTTQLNFARMAELTYGNFATATELANYLVAKHNLPFRQSHHVVGSLVGELSRAGQNFSNFDKCFAHLKANGINAPESEVRAVLDPKTVMLSYKCEGGTGKEPVQDMIRKFRDQAKDEQSSLDKDRTRVEVAHEAARNICRNSLGVKSAQELGNVIAKFAPK